MLKILYINEKNASVDKWTAEYWKHGFQLDFFKNTNQGIAALRNISYDAMIFVIYLQSECFIKKIKKWRKDNISIPILILTECYNTEVKVDVLNAGADDCLPILVKPNEVVARIRAIQRRIYSIPTTELTYGDLVFDTARRVVTNYGKPVKLTSKEMGILELFLLLNPRLLTRRYLEDQLCSWSKDINSNIIEVHISNLRRKLGRDFIETVHGQGYRLKTLPCHQ
ncbi:winged helix-turn-helix domain-containing protein [Citrobacter freundii]|uniref:winged helix-turn-helix domain-containing protein n=1 Tax=Citrobacter freundii TaxID=546 RepID=UPI001EEFF32D|nr:winged helix-turn-helix domain-containing protein [Citrobacter freundii]